MTLKNSEVVRLDCASVQIIGKLFPSYSHTIAINKLILYYVEHEKINMKKLSLEQQSLYIKIHNQNFELGKANRLMKGLAEQIFNQGTDPEKLMQFKQDIIEELELSDGEPENIKFLKKISKETIIELKEMKSEVSQHNPLVLKFLYTLDMKDLLEYLKKQKAITTGGHAHGIKRHNKLEQLKHDVVSESKD